MKKLCAILLCLLTIHSTFAVERWAIVIGIGDYPADSGWKKINGHNDIEIIVPMLCKLGFPEDNIIKLANQSAAKHGIRNAVYKGLIPKLNKGDIVYFHFSGHGQLITDLDGDEDDGWNEAMIPYDAKSKYDWNGYRGENHLVDDELNYERIVSVLKAYMRFENYDEHLFDDAAKSAGQRHYTRNKQT